MRRYAPQENLSFDNDDDHYDPNYRPGYDHDDYDDYDRRQPEIDRYNDPRYNYDNRGYSDSRENLDRDPYRRNPPRNDPDPPRPPRPTSYNRSPVDEYRNGNIPPQNQERYHPEDYMPPRNQDRYYPDDNRRPMPPNSDGYYPPDNRTLNAPNPDRERYYPSESRPPLNQGQYYPEDDRRTNPPPMNVPKPKPSSPLSHAPDYVDPKYGQRPAYNFGFGTGAPLGLKPVSPPPSYKESSRFVPSFQANDNHPAVYSISQQPPLEMKPTQYEPREHNYRRSLIANKGPRSAYSNTGSRTGPRSVASDNRSIASSGRGGHRAKSVSSDTMTQRSNRSHSFVPATQASAVPEKPPGNKLEVIRGGREREEWDNKVQYLLAVVGYAVGLGNIWRFPYLAQKNGGGAFLVPYIAMLLILGIPLLILELHIGQRFRRGPLLAFRDMSKYAIGIGFACMASSFLTACYYNTVIAWCVYYLGMSFRSELAWEKCPLDTSVNGTKIANPECTSSSSATYFWYRETLNIADSIEDAGGVSWKVLLSSIAAWVIVCGCLIKGIKSSGKVVYFTATFPYVVLLIFFIRGCTLEGAGEGLKHLFKPKFSKVFDGVVWREAASQIFFTLSLAGGGLISMSSYNRYNNNYAKDAIIVAVANSLTSLFAGAVIFTMVGHMATLKFKDCNAKYDDGLMTGLIPSNSTNPCDLKTFLTESVSGTGLVFITIAEACTKFGGAGPFFSILFYFMLITLGLDSMFGILEAVIGSISDLSMFKEIRQAFIVLGCCGMGLLLGITFTSVTGEYVFQMFDEYVASIPLFIIAFSEVVVAGWAYGIDNFAKDFFLMTGMVPPLVFLIMLKFVCPVIMIIIFLANIILTFIDGATYSRYDMNKVLAGEAEITSTTPYPGWAKFFCAVLTLVCTVYIPVFVAFVFATKRSLFEKEEAEQFPQQELFNHYDLGVKDPYCPPVLDIVKQKMRREVSVGDEIRSANRESAYKTPRDSVSTNDRAQLYSNSPTSIPSPNSHREGSVNWGMQPDDVGENNSPPRPKRPSSNNYPNHDPSYNDPSYNDPSYNNNSAYNYEPYNSPYGQTNETAFNGDDDDNHGFI